MSKYQLGALTVKDKGLQDTKEEIVRELIDRMQKYVAEGKAAFENGEFTKKQRLNQIEYLCGHFCGLSEFLQVTMGIEVRREDGFMYTQEMFNHFHFWKMNLEIEIKKEREASVTSNYKEVRRLTAGNLRALCIEQDWYTNGTNEEYDHLLRDLAGNKENLSTEDIIEIAEDIFCHSKLPEGCEIEDIAWEVNRVCTVCFVKQ